MPSGDNLLLEYGNEEVVTLAELFRGVVASAEVCQEERSGYRQFLRESGNFTKHSEVINNFYSNETTAMLFPNMAHLARICRVIPIHTADVERTFTQQKLIKTKTRNRMNERNLDSLLRIAIKGPDLNQFPLAMLWSIGLQ